MYHLQVSPLDMPGEGTPAIGQNDKSVEEPMDVEGEMEERWHRIPVKPSQAEIDQHSVPHLQFRAWCTYCVRGRGLSAGHPGEIDHSQDQIPSIAIDDGFLGDKDSPDRSRCIVWKM